MNEHSRQIDLFLTYLRQCERQFHMAEADEKETNDETQDILHSLELEEHNYREFAKLGRELQAVRQRRRVAKDTACITGLVLRWMEDNRPAIKSLERLLGDARKMEKRMESRIYVPRTKRGTDKGGGPC